LFSNQKVGNQVAGCHTEEKAFKKELNVEMLRVERVKTVQAMIENIEAP